MFFKWRSKTHDLLHATMEINDNLYDQCPPTEQSHWAGQSNKLSSDTSLTHLMPNSMVSYGSWKESGRFADTTLTTISLHANFEITPAILHLQNRALLALITFVLIIFFFLSRSYSTHLYWWVMHLINRNYMNKYLILSLLIVISDRMRFIKIKNIIFSRLDNIN